MPSSTNRQPRYRGDVSAGITFIVLGAFILLASGLILVMLAITGEEGRVAVDDALREYERMGISSPLITQFSTVVWILPCLGVVAILKGWALSRSTRRGLITAIFWNVAYIILFALSPDLLTLITTGVVVGALVLYCVLRLNGNLGPKPM